MYNTGKHIYFYMTETLKDRKFSYLNFVKSLVFKRGIVGDIAESIVADVENGKIYVYNNSHVALSRVSSYKDGRVIIFLPLQYTEDQALVEAPRIIIDILRARKSINISEEMKEKLRAEFS